MIIPTLTVSRQVMLGNDVYGQPVIGPAKPERCAPIKLVFKSQHTTVRSDSAASKGHAYEEVDDVVLLFLPTSSVKIGDLLTILGNKTRVDQVHPRYRVTGVLDHLEVHCVGWK